MQARNRSILLVLGSIVAGVTFHDLSRRYEGFRLWDGPPSGYEPHPLELTFFVWYIVLGGIAAGCLALALADRDDLAALEERVRTAARAPWLVPAACFSVFAASLAVKDLVLAGAALSDDENVYRFMAETLARGRLVNPPPPVAAADLGHFQASYVILTDGAWFGKYPIGHPLLLAIGEIVGARSVIGPVLAAATVGVTWGVARHLFGHVGAALTVVLVALSPQLLGTAATDASQNTTQLAMMVGLLFLLRAREAEGGARLRELAIAGLALGFGVLARPMPGAPFVLAAALWVTFFWTDEPLARRVRALLLPGAVVAAFGAVFAFVNWRQTGHPLVSGYQVIHGKVPGVDPGLDGIFSGSFAGSFLRQWVWAFGWPVSFVFLPFARRTSDARHASLAPIWLFLAAGYAYRLTTPKLYVGSTGPVYVAEMVPLLAILTAAGMLALRRSLLPLGSRWARLVGAVAVASTVTSVALFLPFELDRLHTLARPQRFAPDELAARGIQRAVVFTASVVEPGDSWALWPPLPSPDLDDAVIYLRKKKVPEANVAFWKRHFPDRAAFVLEVGEGRRRLRPLAPGSERPITEGRR